MRKPLSAILNDYHGVATSKPLSGEAQNRDALALEYYVPATYPRIAEFARIEGEVKITFRIDTTTGAVAEASAVDGHPMLRQAALDAVRHWHFKTPVLSDPLGDTIIRFSLSCPRG